MDKPRIEKIIERCTPDEKIRVTAYYNATIEKLREYQADKSAGALRDLEGRKNGR